MTPRDVTYFPTPGHLRKWFAANAAKATELWVGFYKKPTGKPSITWPESVDEALCVGWIDGIRKPIDAERYTIRFTPRKPGSRWSPVNIKRVHALTEEGRMKTAGVNAYEARREYKVGNYSYEQRSPELPPEYEKLLKKNKAAWTFFSAQPPGYRKRVMWYVVSATQEATRLERLERLINDWARDIRYDR
jgi:uncharacterized protein YdeI (YjbR/CyaY-like superfamily)